MKNSRIITVLTHIIVWGILYFLFIDNVKMVGTIKNSNSLFKEAILIGTIFNTIIFYTVSDLILPKISQGLSILKALLGCLIILIIISICETIVDFSFFVNLYSTHKDDFIGYFISCTIINLFVMTIGATFGLLKIWRKTEKQKEDLSRETLRAELDFLKAQVNPHFLFNVLNMAYSSASKNDDQETAGIIEELANMMRYMLYESNVNRISLKKEIEYLQSFVNLQKKRLSSEVLPSIEFTITGEIENHQIAPLLLIPFVENAFKHGIRMGNETIIKIRLTVTDSSLLFLVKNSISKNSNELESQYGGVGLENVKKRLGLLYPNQYELLIKEDEKHYNVTLSLNI